MKSTTLYFATNRNHQGQRWTPDSYGAKFSGDGHYNLRFGEISVEYNPTTVNKHLNKRFRGRRSGDGEKLSSYLTKRVPDGRIQAYKDLTSETKKHIEPMKNSSARLFLNIKKEMEQAADVLVYIHGYNVSWDEAVGGAMALQMMLNRERKPADKKVMVILFSWPSDGSMMPYAAYRSDRNDAAYSGEAVGRSFLKLRDFLSQITARSKDKNMLPCNQQIHLLCHSMGNYVLQNALQKMIDNADGSRLPRIFKHIFMCAADVDDNVLENGQPLERLHEISSFVSVYYNHEDLGLIISDYTKSNPERLGQCGNAHPYQIHNKIHQVDCGAIVRGAVEHSYYLWATVNDDIRQSIDDMDFDDSRRKRKRKGNTREWTMM